MRLRPQTYAVTISTYQQHRHFQRTASPELFIATFLRYRDAGKIFPPRFRVMPNHVHVLITPAESTSRAIQLIKGGYSYDARWQSTGEIWHTGYHEHRIRDFEDFQAQKQYIANNPIRKGYSNYPHVHTTHSAPLDAPLHLIEQACS
jgi:putative transposase